MAQTKDSDKVTVTYGEMRRQLEREDRLRVAYGSIQGELAACDSTNASLIEAKKSLSKAVKRKTAGKRFWQGVGIGSIIYAIIKSI